MAAGDLANAHSSRATPVAWSGRDPGFTGGVLVAKLLATAGRPACVAEWRRSVVTSSLAPERGESQQHRKGGTHAKRKRYPWKTSAYAGRSEPLALLTPMLILAAQLALAAVFLYSAADKVRHWNDSISEVAGLGIPAPVVFAAMTVATQLIGGLAVASGSLAAPGALLLAAFTVAATVLGHRFWLLQGQVARREFTTALEHLAIVGGLLLVAQIHGLHF